MGFWKIQGASIDIGLSKERMKCQICPMYPFTNHFQNQPDLRGTTRSAGAA